MDVPAKKILIPATIRQTAYFINYFPVKTEDEFYSCFVIEVDFFGVDSFHTKKIKVSNGLFRKTQILV
jgi:hypothetical protein